MTITEERVIDLLSRLVSIGSINPRDRTDTRPYEGEYELGRFITGWAKSIGLQTTVQEVLPRRYNVLATLNGTCRGRSLLFETHMDTVEVENMTISPFEPSVVGDRLYGRGACDAKGCLASMMLAIETLSASAGRLRTSVTLAAVVDEEHKFRGVSALLESGLHADAAVVGEPTNLDVVIAHKGCLRFRIATRGTPVHTSQAQQGVNAITKMAKVVLVLDALNESYRDRSHPLVGPPTLTVSLIGGGTGVNTVPDRCTIEVDRRVVPGENPEEVLQEIETVVNGLRTQDRDLDVKVEAPYLVDPPMETSPHEPIVQALGSVVAARDVVPRIVGVPYGTDASKLSTLGGIPSVVFGPGSIADAHTSDESTSIVQVRQAAEILAAVATSF